MNLSLIHISITRQKQLPMSTHLARDLANACWQLMERNWDMARPVRMLTVTALAITEEPFAVQQSLFDDAPKADPRREKLEQSLDAIRKKYGRGAIGAGSILHNDMGLGELAIRLQLSLIHILARAARKQADCPPPSKEECLALFEPVSRRVYPAFAGVLGGQPPELRVRDMTSRWGVCDVAKKRITLASRLALQPAAAVEYVIVHEYCHFVHPNHQKDVYKRQV